MSTNQFKVFKETTLPSSLEPNAIYFITHATNKDYVEMYVTSNTGVARRHINENDIKQLITQISSSYNKLTVVNDISARDLIQSPADGQEVFVKDASADSTVSRGGARYLRVDGSWLKISETESLDLVLNWDSIVGKPSSTPTNIDQAVQYSHTHSNKTQLDKIGESDGQLTYNGSPVQTSWKNVSW